MQTTLAPALLARAEALLAEYVRRASLEVSVMASYGTQKHLAELHTRLLEQLRVLENWPNKAFHGLAEALARCLVLYEERPDDYAQLFQGVAIAHEDVFLDCFEGLCLLQQVVHALRDDHSYVFNPATGTIEVESDANAGTGLLSPAKLLAIVKLHTPFLKLEGT